MVGGARGGETEGQGVPRPVIARLRNTTRSGRTRPGTG
jgi:hypothetical protein